MRRYLTSHHCKLCGKITTSDFRVKPRKGKAFYVCGACEQEIFGKCYESERKRLNSYEVHIPKEAQVIPMIK